MGDKNKRHLPSSYRVERIREWGSFRECPGEGVVEQLFRTFLDYLFRLGSLVRLLIDLHKRHSDLRVQPLPTPVVGHLKSETIQA